MKNNILDFLKETNSPARFDIIKKHFPKDYEIIINTFPESFSFPQKLYHYINDDFDLKLGICPVCGKRCVFEYFKIGYRKHCSNKCEANDPKIKEKRNRTNLLLYGNICSLHGKEIEAKTKATMLRKYGKDNPMAVERFQEKARRTWMKKYHVSHPLRTRCIMDKLEQTNLKRHGAKQIFSLKKFQEKSRATVRRKYGKDYVSQVDEFKEKAKQTNFKKTGFYYPMQCEATKEKSRQTCLKKYNHKIASQADEVKEKIRQTNLKEHGIEWYCMHENARKYSSNNSKPNLYFAKKLDDRNILYEREFPLGSYSYDFKVGDILIEISPTITHNSVLNVFGGKPKDPMYHYNKTLCALNHGYKSITVWDWDNIDKIINQLTPKKQISGDYIVKEISLETAIYFEEQYSIYPPHFSYLNYGLFVGEKLIQSISIDKSENVYSISNITSHPDYSYNSILIDYFINSKYPEKLLFEIDNSKYIFDIFDSFKIIEHKKPIIHYHNTRTNQESDSKDEFALPVFNCGYSLFVYKTSQTC